MLCFVLSRSSQRCCTRVWRQHNPGWWGGPGRRFIPKWFHPTARKWGVRYVQLTTIPMSETIALPTNIQSHLTYMWETKSTNCSNISLFILQMETRTNFVTNSKRTATTLQTSSTAASGAHHYITRLHTRTGLLLMFNSSWPFFSLSLTPNLAVHNINAKIVLCSGASIGMAACGWAGSPGTTPD